VKAVPPVPELDREAAEPLLRRLELTVRNRLDGLLQGRYLGLLPGPGSETGESRVYVPGDDVRRIDWAVTARTTETYVRQTIVDRELETWLVVDLSPSLDFGTGRSDKRELALAAITAFTQLTARGGNRVGAVVTTGERIERFPAAAGTAHARGLVRRIAELPRARTGAPGDLAAALELVRRPPRRRGLVAVVSDFMGGESIDGRPDWERPLRGLSDRHELIAAEILDPRELDLPSVGLLTLVDPESGRQIEVQTGRRDLRERYHDAAAAQRAQVAASLRHAGAGHLQLRTDRDWVADVVRFIVARRQAPAPARVGGDR
jgi:uncharacterized protein (DUF58 family)